jgi:hypothetical protein
MLQRIRMLCGLIDTTAQDANQRQEQSRAKKSSTIHGIDSLVVGLV